MRKFPPGEYTAGRGTPARRHTGEPKGLTVGEQARVIRTTAHETGRVTEGSRAEPNAIKRASTKTNRYSEEMESFGEEV